MPNTPSRSTYQSTYHSNYPSIHLSTYVSTRDIVAMARGPPSSHHHRRHRRNHQSWNLQHRNRPRELRWYPLRQPTNGGIPTGVASLFPRSTG